MNFYEYRTARFAAAQDTDWKKHDERFHKGAFDPKTMTCSLREDLGRTDGVDDLGNPKTDSKDAAGPKRWVEFLSLVEKRKGGRDVTPSDIEQMYGELQKIGDRREKKASAWWLAHGTIRLPEDASKVGDALDVAAKAKKDPLSYRSPMELILDNREFRPSEKPIDPDTVPELSDRTDMGHGVVTYLVQDDRDGQKAMRKIIDTHWGKDANPWCLLARTGDVEEAEAGEDAFWNWWESLPASEKNRIGETGIYVDGEDPGDDVIDADADAKEKAREYYAANVGREGGGADDGSLDSAWGYWRHYSALPKRVAFKDGKLLSFMATDADGGMDADDVDAMLSEELLKDHPVAYHEYFETDEMSVSDWILGSRPDLEGWLETAESKIQRDVPEQWWDRKDEAHDGIPLGNMAVPDDPHGRWGDFEIVGGELKRTGGFRKGEDGKSGFVEWYGNGKKKTEITDRMKAKYDAAGRPTSVFEFGKNGGALGSSYFKYDPNYRNDPLTEGFVTIGERTMDGDDLELLFDSGIPSYFRSPRFLGSETYGSRTWDVVANGNGGYRVSGVEDGDPLVAAFNRLLGRFGEAKDKYASMTQSTTVEIDNRL